MGFDDLDLIGLFFYLGFRVVFTHHIFTIVDPSNTGRIGLLIIGIIDFHRIVADNPGFHQFAIGVGLVFKSARFEFFAVVLWGITTAQEQRNKAKRHDCFHTVFRQN